MKMNYALRPTLWLAVMLATGPVVSAGPVLSPADLIIGFDPDITTTSASSYPFSNTPPRAIDGNILTFYENTGGANSGLIITPALGPALIGSFTLTSAPDRPQNDPVSWEIYGTDDGIFSTADSTGTAENWTLVASGSITVPEERMAVSAPVAVNGSIAYRSYRIIFPALKNSPATATALHFSEIQFYPNADGTGDPLLGPTDQVIGIQFPLALVSSYPAAESPSKAIDGLISVPAGSPATKYLNFAKFNTGFIITPNAGATTVQSFSIATANDSEARDPANWILYGTNEAILSTDNSTGDAENWTLIGEGTLSLPAARNTLGGLVDVSFNSTAYTSYRMVFPRVKNPPATNSMQIAEIQFFTDFGGTAPIFTPADPILAIAVAGSASASPNNGTNNEYPAAVLDDNPNTKYLNFGKRETGFIITPTGGPSTVQSFVLTTANDAEGRDPAAWALYGTDDAIVSANNSNGQSEGWTLISEGTLALPAARLTAGEPVSFVNTTAYTSYRLTFPYVKDTLLANSMQVAGVQFYATPDASGEGILTLASPIRAVQLPRSASTSPVAENAPKAIDGNTATKYLNGGGANSGFIVTPAGGPSVITGFTMTTANDQPGRDPVLWSLFGTNSPVLSTNDSTGDKEPWTHLAEGTLTLPDDRFAEGAPVTFANTTAYTSYKFAVLSIKNPALPAMQFAEIQFDGVFTNPSPSIPILDFFRSPGTNEFTLTWASAPGEVFRIAYSTDMSGWTGTVADFIGAGAGDSTTQTFGNPLPAEPKLFFRVEKP
jgi:hypothetical protein